MAMNATLLADRPIVLPPPGKHSDFDAPAEHATALWVVAILTTTIAFLAVTVRFYAKTFVTKQKLSWDDGKLLSPTLSTFLANGVLGACLMALVNPLNRFKLKAEELYSARGSQIIVSC
jgi:hypothetical protein